MCVCALMSLHVLLIIVVDRCCGPRPVAEVNLPEPLGPKLFILGEPVLHRHLALADSVWSWWRWKYFDVLFMYYMQGVSILIHVWAMFISCGHKHMYNYMYICLDCGMECVWMYVMCLCVYFWWCLMHVIKHVCRNVCMHVYMHVVANAGKTKENPVTLAKKHVCVRIRTIRWRPINHSS